ncbi:hypothetical protein FTO70_12220 [Methanosarcina sp. KYL-1]|nr:hypothetical protein [Methanosarcina sp. KYL-1]
MGSPDQHAAYRDEEASLEKTVSLYLVSRLGEENLVPIAAGFLLVGAAAVILALREESTWIIVPGFLLLAISAALFTLEDFYRSRKCRKCGREFAYVPAKEPDIVRWNFNIMETRYYRCRYCGHECVEVKENSPLSSAEM